MSSVRPGFGQDALNVAARRLLLDAIDALAQHRDALVVVGAQAVYLRSQAADLQVAAFTADGDLSVNPSLLGDDPRLEQAMRRAGFELRQREPGRVSPGIWVRTVDVGGRPADISVDLLVPDSVVHGRTGARIPPHSKLAARRVPGLEATLVDHDPIRIASLEPDVDGREAEVRVAGVAGLLISKSHKIADRLEQADSRPDRLTDKDAGDVLRLMMTSSARGVGATMAILARHEMAGPVTIAGLAKLRSQFGAAAAPGVEMAVRALAGGAQPEARIRALAPAFVNLLWTAVEAAE